MTTTRDDGSVAALVGRARDGDQQAWDLIVERFAPLVWSVCVRHRLFGSDADDVGATVWLRLVERLGTIREPAALAGWIATTARNECLHALHRRKRQIPVDTELFPDEEVPAVDEWLLTQERHIALRAAFHNLSERCRNLLLHLFTEPPIGYTEISATLGIPVGTIGPTRMRCLERLRRSPELQAGEDGAP